jgi:hypothetical protein
MHFVAFSFAIFAWVIELSVLIWMVRQVMAPSSPVQLPRGGELALSNGDRQVSAQLKKDWLVMLASTSGVMLTVCLAALSVIYTSSNAAIGPGQRLLGSIPILLSAGLLMFCSVKSLKALGALIMLFDMPRENENERRTSLNTFVANSRVAQKFFIFGSIGLVISILFIIVVFNWAFFKNVHLR